MAHLHTYILLVRACAVSEWLLVSLSPHVNTKGLSRSRGGGTEDASGNCTRWKLGLGLVCLS